MGRSLANQIRGVWASSGILQIGRSRFEDKCDVREMLKASGIGATSSRIAAHTAIASYRTYDAYRAVSLDFAHFAQAKGVSKVQDLRPEHASAFLLDKLNEGLACNTIRTYAAALSKLDQALARASKRMRIPETARLLPGVDAVRQRFNTYAPRIDVGRRAYFVPSAVVLAVKDDTHRLAAHLQLIGGLRISEVMGLHRGSLGGETIDPVFNRASGLLHIKGKGGFLRVQHLPVEDYRALAKHLGEHAGLNICYKPYLADLRQASDVAGETWGGSHGLRHNYVRSFVIDAANAGLRSKAIMREAMERVGHHRVSELKTYCR